jgi:hypothetical protein
MGSLIIITGGALIMVSVIGGKANRFGPVVRVLCPDQAFPYKVPHRISWRTRDKFRG